MTKKENEYIEDFIEIKAGSTPLNSSDAKTIIDKGTVEAVVKAGRITKPAKELFEEYDIAYAENVELDKEKEMEKE